MAEEFTVVADGTDEVMAVKEISEYLAKRKLKKE